MNWNQNLEKVPQNWQEAQGKNISIAVLDTGIYDPHPDLQGIVSAKQDFTEDAGTAADKLGHGSHMAGIIAGQGSAEEAVGGIAPQASLWIGKVLHESLDPGGDIWLANGIKWAIEQNVDIISLSLGIREDEVSDDLKNSIAQAGALGIKVLAAAGDNAALDNQNMQYPAFLEPCISVGAIVKRMLPRDPDFHPQLGIIAPFANYYSCGAFPDNLYYTEIGSSANTAFMAGILALYLSVQKEAGVDIRNLTNGQVFDALSVASTPLNELTYTNSGTFSFNCYYKPPLV